VEMIIVISVVLDDHRLPNYPGQLLNIDMAILKNSMWKILLLNQLIGIAEINKFIPNPFLHCVSCNI